MQLKFIMLFILTVVFCIEVHTFALAKGGGRGGGRSRGRRRRNRAPNVPPGNEEHKSTHRF
jgi:hypothetical protein